MESLVLLYKDVEGFLVSENLLNNYLAFLFLLLLTVVLDRGRLKQKVAVQGSLYLFLSLVIVFFFLFLYIDLFQALNTKVVEYRSGNLNAEIGIYENTSDYFHNIIGDSYTTGIIALLGGIFASFFKLQLIFIEKGYFCKKGNNGSLFLNFIMILNIFSILTFIDHLKYTEFKISEGMVMGVDKPSYFFSLLLLTSLAMFFITLFWHKESILSELITKKETK